MKGTNFRRFFLAIFLVVIFVGSAFADKGVFNAKVTPDEAFVNEPTTVTVTAEIGSENLYISSVRAYKTTADGKPIAFLGQMYDDGTHGDAIEADTIFTMQFTVNEPVKSTIYVRVTAAYRRDRNRYLSPVMKINIFEHLAPDAPAEHANTLNNVKQNFNSYLTTMTPEDAKQKALEDVLNDPYVSDATLSGNTISVQFTDGTWGMITLEDPDVPSEGAGNAIPPNELPSNAKYPGNDNLLIFAPFYSAPKTEIPNYAKNRFANSVFMEFTLNSPAITKDSAASLENVKSWGDFGTVILNGHGGYITIKGHKYVAIATGTPTTQTNDEIEKDLQPTDDSPPRIITTDKKVYAFLPSYITKRAKPMKNTFFWLGACDTLKDSSMWDALRSKGAKVAFGFTKTVEPSFDYDKFKEVINKMVPTDENDDLLSAKEAYDAVGDKIDGWCPFGFCIGGEGAKLELKTAPGWEDFVFFEGGLINGDFETGDWTGWVHGGENGQVWQKILGAHVHNGSEAASLGRWDTSFHGYDPTAEPYGYEWFYQDFVVPDNVTYLKFNWWLETYDTAVWDWFDAYIKDTNGNTLITIVNHGGKPGTNYGPYWNTGSWREESVDISAYRGQKIRIYFDQRLDGFGDQQRVYVDDVRLE
ncbi:hypothetical protein BuS5_03874 [Desulfosarcina sp. BuS5]|nr:hypothetical protein BuS5_03874 [Desulfosarcina sp. BuS5]